MKLLISTALALAAFPALGFAATVSPVFISHSYNSTDAQGTQMYRAELTGLGLTEIGSIKLTDSNSGSGGSTGIYSGFDLDAIFLDIDGSLATTDDRTYASSFLFSAGVIRPGAYVPPSPSGGPTNGSSSATTIDSGWATLSDIDAVWFGAGSLTLGDGGALTAVFAPTIDVLSSLYLFVGEVSGDPGETVSGLIEVSDTVPAVPLPATGLLLLGALGVFGLRRKQRTQV